MGVVTRALKKGLSATASAAKTVTEKVSSIGLKSAKATATISKPIAKGIGQVGLSTGKALFKNSGKENPVGYGVKKIGQATHWLSKDIIKYTPETKVLNKATGEMETKAAKLRLTPKGFAVVGGIAMVGSTSRAYDNTVTTSMGQTNPTMQTNTPDYKPKEYSFLNNGGATGDLVFALHANRNG